MFCNNCGTQIPDKANFCWNCGKPQKSSVAAPEPVWETCEVEFEMKTGSMLAELLSPSATKYRFVVKAVGPSGMYVVLETPFTGFPKKEVQEQILKSLVAKLTSEGWESIGKGEQTYSYKFRRKVRP